MTSILDVSTEPQPVSLRGASDVNLFVLKGRTPDPRNRETNTCCKPSILLTFFYRPCYGQLVMGWPAAPVCSGLRAFPGHRTSRLNLGGWSPVLIGHCTASLCPGRPDTQQGPPASCQTQGPAGSAAHRPAAPWSHVLRVLDALSDAPATGLSRGPQTLRRPKGIFITSCLIICKICIQEVKETEAYGGILVKAALRKKWITELGKPCHLQKV